MDLSKGFEEWWKDFGLRDSLKPLCLIVWKAAKRDDAMARAAGPLEPHEPTEDA